ENDDRAIVRQLDVADVDAVVLHEACYARWREGWSRGGIDVPHALFIDLPGDAVGLLRRRELQRGRDVEVVGERDRPVLLRQGQVRPSDEQRHCESANALHVWVWEGWQGERNTAQRRRPAGRIPSGPRRLRVGLGHS